MKTEEVKNPFVIPGFSDEFDKIASLIKEGDYRLPEDPAQWNAAIQDAMETQLPEIAKAGGNPHIVYKHKDWGTLCAVGSMSLAPGGNLLVFPVVIRYGNLAPFDMVYVHNQDKWLHTSEENMRQFEAQDSNSVFGGVSTKDVVGDNEYSDRWEYLQSPKGFSFRGGSRLFTGPQVNVGCPIDPLNATMKYAQKNMDRILFTSDHVRTLFKAAEETASKTTAYYYETAEGNNDGKAQFGPAELEKPTHTEEDIGDGEITPLSIKQANQDMRLPIFNTVPQEDITAIREYQEDRDELMNPSSYRKVAMQFSDLLFVEKAGLNDYIAKMGRRGYNGAFEVRGGISKMAEMLSDGDTKAAAKILDAVDNAQSILVDSAATEGNMGQIETLGNVALINDGKRVTRFGIYDVFTEEGDKEAGHVIPLVDWNGDITTMFLYISDRSWALQSNINGTISSYKTILPAGVLHPDTKGAFVYDKDGNGITFPPIEIKKVVSTGAGVVVRAIDLGNMHPVNIVMSKDVPAVMEFQQSNDPQNWIAGHTNVYMPIGVKFVPIPDHVTKIASVNRALEQQNLKMASLSPEVAKISMESGRYYVTTDHNLHSYPEGMKTAMKDAKFVSYNGQSGLSRKEAEFALRLGGAIMPEQMVSLVKEGREGIIHAPVEAASKMASSHESLIAGAMLSNFMALPARYKAAAVDLRLDTDSMLDVITLAPKLSKTASGLLAEVLNTSHPLVKASKNVSMLKGADYEDKPSLDDLFELGFLNEKNLQYYTGKMQDIEDLEDFLCKILITTRMSGLGLDEDSAQNALYGVSELKNALTRINFRVNRAH